MRGERLLRAPMWAGTHVDMSTTRAHGHGKEHLERGAEGRVVDLLSEELNANGDVGQPVNDE